MSYLISKFKGKYRLNAPIDINTNAFPREVDGSFADNDVYIDCQKGIKIFYWGGRGILQAYIPSLGAGRNIVKQIYRQYINPDNVLYEVNSIGIGDKIVSRSSYTIKDIDLYEKELKQLTRKDIIFDIEESDSELLFKFKDDRIIEMLKPKTSAANRSPFSSKYLPVVTYDIPKEDMDKYDEITKDLTVENGGWLKVNRITKKYLMTLTNKKFTKEDLVADMTKKCLKQRDYIHSLGKWDEYIKFLKKGLEDED